MKITKKYLKELIEEELVSEMSVGGEHVRPLIKLLIKQGKVNPKKLKDDSKYAYAVEKAAIKALSVDDYSDNRIQNAAKRAGAGLSRPRQSSKGFESASEEAKAKEFEAGQAALKKKMKSGGKNLVGAGSKWSKKYGIPQKKKSAYARKAAIQKRLSAKHGVSVKQIQQLLKIEDDGRYGKNTYDAILSWQKKHMPRKGKDGKNNWDGLFGDKALAVYRSSRKGKKPAASSVIKIQRISVKLDKNKNEYFAIATTTDGKQFSGREKRSGTDDSGDIKVAKAEARSKAMAYIASQSGKSGQKKKPSVYGYKADQAKGKKITKGSSLEEMIIKEIRKILTEGVFNLNKPEMIYEENKVVFKLKKMLLPSMLNNDVAMAIVKQGYKAAINHKITVNDLFKVVSGLRMGFKTGDLSAAEDAMRQKGFLDKLDIQFSIGDITQNIKDASLEGQPGSAGRDAYVKKMAPEIGQKKDFGRTYGAQLTMPFGEWLNADESVSLLI